MNINAAIYNIKKIFKIGQSHLPIIACPNDVWLASFPKSGNTWASFILGNIIIDYCSKNIAMNFDNLQQIIPDIYVSRNIPTNLGFDNLPRIIKTHEPYCDKYKKSIYVIRDPRDVMVSYFHYLRDGHNKNYNNFSKFIRSNKGIAGWCRHIKGWMNKYDVIISYEQLKRSPKHEIKKILQVLNINISDKKIYEAIEKSSFNSMRKIEANSSSEWKNMHNLDKDCLFVRKGEINQWRKYFSDSDLVFYQKLTKKTGLEPFIKEYNYD